MSFDHLPQEKQESLMMLGHRLEIEVEDDKRRKCTRLGYRFGGTVGLAATVVAMLTLSAILVFALAFAAPSLDVQLSTSPLFWGCFAPMALIPILPFVFMKPRFALAPLAFIITVLVVVGLLAGGGVWLEGVMVRALL